MVTLAAELTALVTILGVVWALWRRTHALLKRWAAWVKNFDNQIATIPTLGTAIRNLEEKVDAQGTSLALIKREVMPNGSSSLRDAIERIEERQALDTVTHQSYLSEMGIATWRSNENGEYLSVNREFCRMTGRIPEECLKDRWINSIAPAQREAVVVSWNHAVDDKRDWTFTEAVYEKPDGSQIRARIFAYALYSNSGTFVGHHGFIRRRGIEDHV